MGEFLVFILCISFVLSLIHAYMSFQVSSIFKFTCFSNTIGLLNSLVVCAIVKHLYFNFAWFLWLVCHRLNGGDCWHHKVTNDPIMS